MAAPVRAQACEARVRQRHVAVLGALAAVHVDHHACRIDVGDFQIQRLLQPQPAGVDGGEEGAVVGGVHVREDGAHFAFGENGGKPRFGPRPQVVEELPVPLQHLDEVEANPAVADAHGVGGPAIDILAVQEVGFQFRLGDRLGGLVAVELAQHPQCAGVSFLGTLGLAVQRQRVDGLLEPVVRICHDCSPRS